MAASTGVVSFAMLRERRGPTRPAEVLRAIMKRNLLVKALGRPGVAEDAFTVGDRVYPSGGDGNPFRALVPMPLWLRLYAGG